MPSTATKKRQTAKRKANQHAAKKSAQKKFIEFIKSEAGKKSIEMRGPAFAAKVEAMLKMMGG